MEGGKNRVPDVNDILAKKQFYCEKCGKTMDEVNFYSSKNVEKYPEKRLHICKKCITMHVDNWNPDTYLWILQECDVPYVPDVWNALIAKNQAKGTKITSLTILGRYLAQMQMKQYRDFSWKDTEFLQDLKNKKIEETMKRQGYDIQQITDAIEKGTFDLPEKVEQPEYEEEPLQPNPPGEDEDYFAQQSGAANDNYDLTEEERMQLRLKWGKSYKVEEWLWLEKFYREMMQSYDIQTAAHIDTLKLICKTSLKAHQLIDMGDMSGYKDASRVYNELMKAGAFTAAQNKQESGDFVDSVGELVALCEKEGFIEKFYIDEPNDKVDETIADMQRFTRTLITEETNLTQLLEDAIKSIQKEDAEKDSENSVDDIYESDVDEIEHQLKEKDFEDFNDFLENEEISDEQIMEYIKEQDPYGY